METLVKARCLAVRSLPMSRGRGIPWLWIGGYLPAPDGTSLARGVRVGESWALGVRRLMEMRLGVGTAFPPAFAILAFRGSARVRTAARAQASSLCDSPAARSSAFVLFMDTIKANVYGWLVDRAEAIAAFKALAPYNAGLGALHSRCRPFGRDNLALELARQGLESGAFHFTRQAGFYGLKGDGGGGARPAF